MANVNFLNPFLRAVQEVLQMEVGLQVRRGDLTLQNSAYTTSSITTLLSMVGAVRGVVLYGMDQPMALKLVSTMLGQEQEEFDDLAQSGIAEMGNVITGLAATYLTEAGYTCNISVPTVISGSGTMISTLDFRRLVVPLHTDFGDMSIHLALREDQKHMRTKLMLNNAQEGQAHEVQPPAPTPENILQLV
ncbi:MAG: chemotaxis protein CheX [Caldilineaceae bacterium]|nr:chemotaxis protein CheX [Caldilineaceae bacterium]